MKEVPLSQSYVALVSDKDYQRVSQFKWHIIRNRTTVYAYSRLGKPSRKGAKEIPMHSFIVGGKADHKDHYGLNNQRYNLRLATQSQNLMNMSKTTSKTSSRYKSVCWHKAGKKWFAYIKLKGKMKYIGLFAKEKDAALAYDVKAKELFGEFANPNFKEQL